jgi:hypothetical protein
MIHNFRTIRQIAYDFRKFLFERPRIPKQIPVIEGLPEGLDIDLLNRICLEQCQGHVDSVSHQHLSGWKKSGAYRLLINSTSGNRISLIFKEAFYGENVIPALADLPVRPGPSEYAVFSQANGALAPFLPKVFHAEECVAGTHYRYLIEDLAENYHSAAGDRAALQAVNILPSLHTALNEWAQSADTHNFIAYGKAYSTALQHYALPKLTAYQQEMPNPNLQKVLDNWPKISALHLQPEFFSPHTICAIHGDSNFTNIYIHNEDPSNIKVVDWEWAGFHNNPFADLVSLLKGTSLLVERKGVASFISTLMDQNQPVGSNMTGKQYNRMYHWSKLERGILDSAFLAAQVMYTDHKGKFNMVNAVNSSLHRILTSYQQLS